MPRWALTFLVFGLCVSAGATVRWNDILRQPPEWYGGDEARAIAANVLQYQTSVGGWPKNKDMTAPPSAEFLAETHPDHRSATIDNKATTTQIELLARITSAHKDEAVEKAVLRGIDYLLEAQYPNGGWPQYFPLRKGYYTHITYNDNAMVNALTVLRDVAEGKAPYAFVDETRRKKAAAAVDKGIDCILRTQVKQDGKLTAWCAQHDETTLAPAWARNFEPPSLSGDESVAIVRFLMTVERPAPEIVAAIEGAIGWFKASVIHGLRWDKTPGEDGKKDAHAVPDEKAPPLWARFYELGSNRPIFIGRDKVIRYDFNEIERERRAHYDYFGDWPSDLLEKKYPQWLKRRAKTS